MITNISTKKRILYCAFTVVVILLGLGIGFGLRPAKDDTSRSAIYEHAAVSANGPECAAIGRDILKKGGSAADSAIATLLCEGVACPQSSGIGGGFLLTIYIKEHGTVRTLNARETAPAAASKDMYEQDPSKAKTGGLSVAVPGELRGYWALHQNYGALTWKELFEPTIELCKKGHLVTHYLSNVLKDREKIIKSTQSLSEIFINPKTGQVYKEGDRIQRLKLAETLATVAEHGPDALYNGTLTEGFVKDIKDAGGIITVEDMQNYVARWEKPVMAKLSDDLVLHTISLPGSGDLLAYILRVLRGMVPGTPITKEATAWQRIVEMYKFAYGARSQLGDPDFVAGMKEFLDDLSSEDRASTTRSKISDTITYNNWTYYGGNFSQFEDHGTAHVSVLAANGDAVAVTSTINYILGAMFRSTSTGIILNDEMDDFSIPNADNIYGVRPSPANYIAPGKHPLSSMCPTIITDNEGNVRLVIGAAGGTKITTAVAYTTIRHLWYNDSLTEAVDAKRMHHQLFPMAIQHESGFNEDLIMALRKIGHDTIEVPAYSGFAALTAVAQNNGKIYAAFDPRRSGSIAGY